jgi:hypothetical protein
VPPAPRTSRETATRSRRHSTTRERGDRPAKRVEGDRNDRFPPARPLRLSIAVYEQRRTRDPARMKPYRGPPATLGSTAAARARLIVWCRDCRHQVEPDPAEMAERYGAELSVIDWVKRLKCSQCGSRGVDFVLTGATYRPIPERS